MSEEKPVQETQAEKGSRPARRSSRSAFAPVVLIAAGVFFLLDNLGVIGGLDWDAALRFWPLALIFLGLNVLVVQARPPLGSILSLLVALAAVATFGWLLLRGSPDAMLRSAGVAQGGDLREESFAITPGAARTAEITLHLSNFPAAIAPGDAGNLISGTIWTRTGLDMRPGSEGDDHITVEVGEERGGPTLNFADWVGQEREWTFELTPDLPIDLTIDAGNSAVQAELAGLALSRLVIDASNGRVSAALPDGDYDVRLDGGNGGANLLLPAGGEREVAIDGGNGGIHVTLPDGVAARVEYRRGNGGVNVDGRFERVEGDREEGAYETADYDTAADRVLFIVETGNGGVSISSDE